jgi:ankyrin repeat protein
LLAAQNGHQEVVKLLLQQTDVVADSTSIYFDRTSLSYAVGNGHEAGVKLLIEWNDVESEAENRHEAIVKLLVEGGDVESDGKDEIDDRHYHMQLVMQLSRLSSSCSNWESN